MQGGGGGGGDDGAAYEAPLEVSREAPPSSTSRWAIGLLATNALVFNFF